MNLIGQAKEDDNYIVTPLHITTTTTIITRI